MEGGAGGGRMNIFSIEIAFFASSIKHFLTPLNLNLSLSLSTHKNGNGVGCVRLSVYL